MKKIIAACGNDCLKCPRYLPKPEEELKKTAELWYKIGYRDKVVSTEEIACNGCAPRNWCRYNIIQCVIEKEIDNCGECEDYQCKRIKETFEQTLNFAPQCEECCSEYEYNILAEAFFEKKKNLDEIYYKNKE